METLTGDQTIDEKESSVKSRMDVLPILSQVASLSSLTKTRLICIHEDELSKT